MKTKLLTICFLISFVTGCSDSINALYNPNKTFEEAVRDYEECWYDVVRYTTISGQGVAIQSQCMSLRGYRVYNVKDLVENGEVKVRKYNISGDYGFVLRGLDKIAGKPKINQNN